MKKWSPAAQLAAVRRPDGGLGLAVPEPFDFGRRPQASQRVALLGEVQAAQVRIPTCFGQDRG